MRVALCLSGQPRWFAECSSYFKSNILDNFENVDVYLHAWFDGNAYTHSIQDLREIPVIENTISVLWETYRPTAFVTECPIKFVDNESYPYPRSMTLPNNAYSMFYSVKKCIEMVSEREKRENFVYDWVFRSRFDYAINRKFTPEFLKTLEKNVFYSPHVRFSENPHCHADFNLGCSETMRAYSQTFCSLETLGKNGVTLSNEGMTYYHLVNQGFQVKELNLYNQFPPSKSSACWHSLWGHR